ncbi:MAG TPA: M23 family metallopeptidase [Gemmatimonadaceae bacterium]
MSSGQVLLRSVATLIVLAAGCTLKESGDAEPAAARAPSAGSAAAAHADSGAAAIARTPPFDSLRGIVGGVAAVVPRLPTDTTTVVATPDELRDLAARMTIPVQGIRAADLRNTFDERRGGGTRPHEALDILAPRGTPVLSATDGVVRKKHASVPGGLMVYAADAGDRFILMYGHLDRYADGLTEGQPLARGQVIGYVGTTGNAPVGTPHLHFAIARGHPSQAWWRGSPVNPFPLLTAVGAAAGNPR